MSVFVIDLESKPLLPTNEARARILLKQNKATVYSVEPFTIQLNKIIDNPVGESKLGIDDGAKIVGISIGYKENVVFAGEITLRQDVSRKMLQRAQYRRTRRLRNLRHRKARFLNRGKKGWLPPSIKYKKDAILRMINDLQKRINIMSCVVEQGQFDTSSLSKGYKLSGEEYQQSDFEGNNWRQKILWRDNYCCQHCNSKEKLQAHHIIFKSKGGTNSLNNGITLCENCHSSLHKEEWKLNKRVKLFKYPSHLQQGKGYLFNQLNKRFKTQVCFGWMTAKARKELNLEKSHHADASAMIGSNIYKCHPYIIKPKRTKIWNNNPTKTCEEKNGFRHYDIVKAVRKNRIVVGSIRSLKKTQITLRTSFDNDFPVSYHKSKLIWRPNRIIYIRMLTKSDSIIMK